MVEVLLDHGRMLLKPCVGADAWGRCTVATDVGSVLNLLLKDLTDDLRVLSGHGLVGKHHAAIATVGLSHVVEGEGGPTVVASLDSFVHGTPLQGTWSPRCERSTAD